MNLGDENEDEGENQGDDKYQDRGDDEGSGDEDHYDNGEGDDEYGNGDANNDNDDGDDDGTDDVDFHYPQNISHFDTICPDVYCMLWVWSNFPNQYILTHLAQRK